MWPHRVSIRKADGREIANVVANVQPGKILLRDVAVDVDEGDTISRQLASKVEEYVATYVHNTGPVGELSHIAIDVQKASALRVDAARPQFVQHFNAPVGAVQNGDQNTANVTIGFDLARVRELLAELRTTLEHEVAPAQIVEVRDLVESVEAEIARPAPRKHMLKTLLNALGPMAQGAAGNLLSDLAKLLLS